MYYHYCIVYIYIYIYIYTYIHACMHAYIHTYGAFLKWGYRQLSSIFRWIFHETIQRQLRGHSAAVLSLAFRAQAGCENRSALPWQRPMKNGAFYRDCREYGGFIGDKYIYIYIHIHIYIYIYNIYIYIDIYI